MVVLALGSAGALFHYLSPRIKLLPLDKSRGPFLIDSYEDGSEIVQLSNSSSLTSFRSTGKMNLSLASIPGVQLDIRYRPSETFC